MGLREVKTKVNDMTKPEIIKLISEMYKSIPQAKNYLDIYISGDIKNLIVKYKKQIEKYVYPSTNNLVLREAEARKLIRTVKKMKVSEINIELELFYVTCCLDVIADFGYNDDNYYIAIDKMFYEAMKEISDLGIYEKYEKEIENISARASEFGLELHY